MIELSRRSRLHRWPVLVAVATGFALGGVAGYEPAMATPVVKPSAAALPTTPPVAGTAPAAAPSTSAANAAAEAAKAAAEAAERKLEIDTARARCTALLATITAVAIAREPIEDGSCGDLAPVELVSVGKNPAVAVSPPAILNCDMAVAIHNWMKFDVQPLARKHMGKDVVKLETMSSYSCRNAYGRTMSKLSEHGKANALDIRGFVTSAGQPAYVLTEWGMTSGEIRAAAAAAEKEQNARMLAEKAQAEARTRALAAAKSAAPPREGATGNPIANAGTLVDGLPKPGITFGNEGPRQPTNYGLTQPNRLGGPKPVEKTSADSKTGGKAAPGAILSKAAAAPAAATSAGRSPADQNLATATSLFLRAVHESACKRFSTTLGPETNAAHRNHFHIDLAQRNTAKKICE